MGGGGGPNLGRKPAILRALREAGCRTVDDLADELRLTPHVVSAHLWQLKARGLVHRVGTGRKPGPGKFPGRITVRPVAYYEVTDGGA